MHMECGDRFFEVNVLSHGGTNVLKHLTLSIPQTIYNDSWGCVKGISSPPAASISLLEISPFLSMSQQIFIKQPLPCQKGWGDLGFVSWSGWQDWSLRKTNTLSLSLSLSPGVGIAVPGQGCWRDGCFVWPVSQHIYILLFVNTLRLLSL